MSILPFFGLFSVLFLIYPNFCLNFCPKSDGRSVCFKGIFGIKSVRTLMFGFRDVRNVRCSVFDGRTHVRKVRSSVMPMFGMFDVRFFGVRSIEQLMDCKQLAETHVKTLCEKVRNFFFP